MRLTSVTVALAALFLVGCGSSSPDAAPTVDSSIAPVDGGSVAPVDTERPSASSSMLDTAPDHFVQGECLAGPGDWPVGGFAVEAKNIRVSERYAVDEDPINRVPAIIRDITVDIDRVVANSGGQALTSSVVLADIEAVMTKSGELVGMSSVDYVELEQMEDPVVTGVVSADGIVVLAGVFGSIGGGTHFAGPCTGTIGRTLDELAPQLGYASGRDLFVDWIDATAMEDADALSRFTQAEADLSAQRDDAGAWYAADPRRRSLNPIDVPEEIRQALDVRGVKVDLSGLPEGSLVELRSDSGVSYGLSASAAQGSVVPVFFVAGVDELIEVVITDVETREKSSVVASIDAGELARSGGLALSGMAEAPTVSVLSENEFADVLGVPTEKLRQMRLDYLNPQ